MYVAVMLWVPALKIVCSDAVAPAKAVAVAEMLVTVTGFPICVPLLKNVTVPLGPAALLLWVVTVDVKVTGVAVVTPVDGLAPTPAPVCACVMVTFRSAELVLKLGLPWYAACNV